MMKRISICILSVLLLMISGCKAQGQEMTEMEMEITFKPGEIVPDDLIGDINHYFSVNEISDEIFSVIKGKSFKDNCTLSVGELRYILCLHKDIDGVTKVGEMIVNKEIAMDVVEILKELYINDYPIENMRLIDYYDADDETSMRANNSSSFNFRFVTHTTTVSKHGAGMAVDINPLYNPYYKVLTNGEEDIEPATGAPYIDRSKEFDYKISKDDLCYRLFIKHGFEWGGDWTSCKDYQHFEK